MRRKAMDEKQSILIVDDDESTCRTLALIFEKKGYEIETAGTGRGAIEKAQGRFFNVALLDVRLPDVEGVELLAPLKEMHSDMELIVVTGHASLKTAVQALNEGASGYITKPLDMDEVLAKVRDVLEKQRLVEAKRRAEAALWESEERFRRLAENAQDLIYRYRFNPTPGFEYVSPAAAAITGYTPEEHYADPELGFKLVHPDDRALLEALTRGDTPPGMPLVFRWVRKDGTMVWIEQRNVLIYDEAGHLVAIEGIARDITARKRTDEEIHRLNQFLDSVIDNANVWLDVIDDKVNVVIWNKAAEEISGYSREEVVGHNKIWEWLYPDEEYRNEVMAKAATIIGKSEEEKGSETIIRRKDGQSRIVSWNSRSLVDEEGNPIGSIAIGHDITGRKHLEEQLLQSQKMEAVGRLAGGIAHDFNNLLTVIIGFTELLLYRHLDDLSPLRGPLEEVQKAGKWAASLTHQLLAFSRKQVLQPKVLDLNAVVADTEKMLRRLIGEDIDLVTVLDPELGPVKVDPGQLEQVIMNLAVNARDAMPQGGKLTIETANVELDEAYARRHTSVQPGPYVMLAVSDTGIGMGKETQSHLFEPFFTTKEKGIGLGLPTIYGIVKQSGGHIWVYSEPGLGTTFKVYLPRVEEAVEPPQPGTASAASLQGSETVLLVEDDGGVRMLVRDVLEISGYTVLEARHGEEALLICQQHSGPIHLMVTDVVMPGMSGRELAERLSPLYPEMKVLYISGYTEKGIVHHGVLDPATAFLQKPFTPNALAHKVRQVLDAPQKEPPYVPESRL
jgi:two-component system cell cycle sensor histidine kinase/response regulator CckA